MSDKAYMCWCYDSAEGACLVFAPNETEALTLGIDVMSGWFAMSRAEVTEDAEAKELPDLPKHLWALYEGHPHAIESPPVCEHCELWGYEWSEQAGMCVECWEIEYG